MISLASLCRRLATYDKQHSETDSHDYETDIPDVIVTQSRDFRHHLAVLLRRDKRQHALDNEHKGNCRENFRGYFRLPSD